MKLTNPKPDLVIKHLEDVQKTGIVDQTSTGMIYLDIDDDFIFKALEVLRPFGYIRPGFFTYPPPPVGAHIKIVSAEEAMDRELLPHKTPPSPAPGEHNYYLGERVDFEVERAFPSQPKLRRYGVVAKYKLKVVSPELDKIRMDLIGLAPPKTGFYITLAVMIEEIMGPLTDPMFEDGKNENSLTQKIKEEDLDQDEIEKKGRSDADKSSKDDKSKRSKGKDDKSPEVGKSKTSKQRRDKADKSSGDKNSKKKKKEKGKEYESTDDKKKKSESKKTEKKPDKIGNARKKEEVIKKNLMIASIVVNSLTVIVLGFIINSE